MALCLTIRYEEVVKVGETIIKVKECKGNQVRLEIHAPKDMLVMREKFINQTPKEIEQMKRKLLR